MVVGIIVGLFLVFIGLVMFVARDDMGIGGGFAVLAVGIIITGVSSSAGMAYYNERTLECTIVDKDRGYTSQGQSEYRVYTEQCGTFVNQDSMFRGKFNSGDVQGQLQVGETYELVVAGPRVGLFSMFPNIFEVRPVA